jgi:hypothetical protein
MFVGQKRAVYADEGILLSLFLLSLHRSLHKGNTVKKGLRPKTEFNVLIFKE